MPASVQGALELRKAMRKFEPELAKETQKEIAGLLKRVVSKARGFVPSQAPLSGWGNNVGLWGGDRTYNAGMIKRGIGYSTTPSKPNKRGFRSLASVFNKSVAGSIYETAGRKNPQGQPPAKRTVAYRNGEVVPAWQSGKDINTSANPNAGKQFINAMGPMYVAKRQAGQGGRVGRKMNGRLIFRAWGEDEGRTNAAVIKAIEKSMSKVLTLTKGNNINFRGR
jgi:hypothetical protein